MSYFQEKLDIEEAFKTFWGNETPIVFGNGANNNSGTHIRLSIQNGDARQVSMGSNPAFRYPGVVSVQIFTRKNIGEAVALKLADKIDEFFRNKVINRIQFKVPQILRVPTDSEWFQIIVSIHFYRGS